MKDRLTQIIFKAYANLSGSIYSCLGFSLLFFMAVGFGPLCKAAPDTYTYPSEASLVNPPVFVDPVPDDIIIDCIEDFPAPVSLTAEDDTDPSFPKEIEPVDFPAVITLQTCTGGTVVRTWTATDMDGNVTEVNQVITILPDASPPIILVEEVHDTIACDDTQPVNDYNAWITARRLSIGTNIGLAIYDECSGVQTFSDDAPSTFTHPCSTLLVTFTITDSCGMEAFWQASYTTYDTIAPIIEEAPADTTVTCDGIPTPVAITATDNCSNISPVLTQDTIPGSCAHDYTLRRTWIATDLCGNADTTEQLLFVIDTVGPVLVNTPAIDTLYLDCPEDIPAPETVTVDDNCIDPLLPTFTADTIPGNFCPQGNLTIRRMWTVSDDCGYTDTARQVIIVQDTLGPSLVNAPNDTIMLDCNDPIPDPPTVSVDNGGCSFILESSYTADTIPDGNCPNYRFTIIRTWLVADVCGKGDTARQMIQVSDTQAPSFTVPPNITISCADDPENLSVTGNVVNVSDNCDPDPIVVFQDQIMQDGGCPQAYTIRRTWRVIDACNNVTGKNQLITIVDDQAPTFNVPNDITVDCGEENDFNITGVPTNVIDNCDDALSITFEDNIIPGSCVNTYTVQRLWHVEDDCGNFTELFQNIDVQDTSIPVFQTAPQNLTLECANESQIATAFQEWIDDNGGAVAVDNCSASVFLNWFAYNSGTTDPALLPPYNCPSPGGITRELEVDFVVVDECGNQTTTTARFRVIDTTPPSIINCPSDTFAITDMGNCSGSYTFFPPVVEETCGATLSPAFFTDTQPITYSGAGDPLNEPADPITFDFDLAAIAPVSIAGPVTLSIQLANADAESPTEYFIVKGEDGTVIGQTVATNMQCGSSNTLLFISAAQANIWSVDGIITITLEPFIPPNQSGAFAINALCNPQGMVTANMAFDNRDLSNLTFEYQFNDEPRVTIVANGPIEVAIDAGQNTLKYFVTDCAGNVDSCSYNVEIRDEEAPEVLCAAPITLSADEGSCVTAIELPAIEGATDNCALSPDYFGFEAATSSMAESMLTFAFNPNLPGYLAQTKSYAFSGFGTDVTDDVTLTATFMGDFNTNGAFFTITGEGGFLLGTTMVGAADCATEGTASFTIPVAQFNIWNADGIIEITATPNPVSIPPPFPDSGVNPCDPGAVNSDGDNDGISFLQFSIGIGYFRPGYYAEGATTIPPAQFPSNGATPPTFDFNVGQTTLYYIMADHQNNTDTCEVPITIIDDELPTAICNASAIVDINPASPAATIIDPAEIDGGSFDNCGIDTLFIPNNGFTCNLATDTMTVSLIVRDSSGNESSCQSLIRFENAKPDPTYNGGLCAGDTLFLFTNPPATGPGEFFLYSWTGPENFMSNSPNPFIPGAGADNAGTYSVTITGITGCTSSNTVFVDIGDLPLQPQLITQTQYCNDETIELVTTALGQQYRWSRGLGANTVLLGVTTEPFFNIDPPLTPGSAFYSVVVETGAGCLSQRSEPINVTVTERPVASVSPAEIVVCEGEQIVVSSPVTGTGLSYFWQGPFNFEANSRVSVVTDSATVLNSGVYELMISKNGCESEPAEVIVTVLPRPPRPQLFYSGDVCQGESITFTTNINNGETYLWQSENGDFSTSTNSFTIDAATLLNGGTWQVVVNRFGCPSEMSLPVEVEVYPIPPTVGSVSPPEACEGEMVQLSSTPLLDGATYVWVAPNNDTLAGPAHQIMEVGLDYNGTFTLTITSQQGCAKTVNVELEILPSVSVTALSSNAPDCLLGPMDVSLSASVFPPDDGNYTYYWTGPNDFESFDAVAIIPGATSDESGSYNLVVTTGDGCSSAEATIPVALNDAPLTPISPQPNPSGQVNYCLGDEIMLQIPPYSGMDVTYNWFTPNGLITTSDPSLIIDDANTLDSGAYRVQVLIDGCASNLSGITIIDVNEVPTVTASSNSPVCEGETIQLSSNSVPGVVYSWSGLVTSTNQNPQIPQADSVAHDGLYTVTANLLGCISEPVTVDVVVHKRPPAPSLQSNGPICISDPDAELVLSVNPTSATPGGSYIWSDADGPISPEINALNFTITNFDDYNSNGSYLFYATAVRNGCSSSISDPVSVLFNLAPDETAIAGQDTTLCLDDFIDLTGNEPGQGTASWTLISGDPDGIVIESPGDGNTTVEGVITGLYTLQWAFSNGVCVNYSSDEVTLNVSEGEEAIAGEDFTACFDDDISLNAFSPVLTGSFGEWTQSATQDEFGIIIADSLDANTMVDGFLPGGTYFFNWTVYSSCGQKTDQIAITISDPFPDAGDDQFICDGNALTTLNARTPLGNSEGRWSSPTAGVSISNPQDTGTTVFDLAIGENIFVWTIDDGICDAFSRDTVSIFFYDSPSATDDQVGVDFGETVTFNVLENDNIPPDAIVTEISLPTRGNLQYLGNGVYEYTAAGNFNGTDEFIYEACTPGCDCVQASVLLGVDGGAECIIPSIFTPNNDGVNDFFIIPCLANTDMYPNSQIIIFNRWGDEVYRSPVPYANNWNGTYDGEDLPPSTYFYIVDFGNGEEPESGFVVIQR